ncbi:DUF2958 domain-containing protein [Candidatus Magnetobacterium casense]|uniref:DUF2958 domain-containing protein n=1 Tax=Candidatus Magnetobacterium casense TaxID=1455061 RepID=UPI001C43B2DB|nr:DUF2958 domain-containing protein [Candidatus Magnetobacterium casensis]
MAKFKEGDRVVFEPTIFDALYYSKYGIQRGDIGYVTTIPGYHGRSIYTDPMKKLLAVRWNLADGQTMTIGTAVASVKKVPKSGMSGSGNDELHLKAAFPNLTQDQVDKLSEAFRNAQSHEEVDAALELANEALGGYGVEAVPIAGQVDKYYYNTGALYVALGDTYDTTILYDTREEKFFIGSWGDWLEEQQSDEDDPDSAFSQTLENISSAAHWMEGMPDGWEKEVYGWLFHNTNFYEYEGDNGVYYPPEKEVIRAMRELWPNLDYSEYEGNSELDGVSGTKKKLGKLKPNNLFMWANPGPEEQGMLFRVREVGLMNTQVEPAEWDLPLPSIETVNNNTEVIQVECPTCHGESHPHGGPDCPTCGMGAPIKLLTKDILKKLPPLYSQENVEDPIAYVKFFTPDSNWTWYALEYDGKDLFFGLVKGLETELGYFSLSELQTSTGPHGLHIERDTGFKPTPLSKIRSGEVS